MFFPGACIIIIKWYSIVLILLGSTLDSLKKNTQTNSVFYIYLYDSH